ncbi:3-oxoacyl-[acyl-carrier-protein] synthase 2 [bacterium BMS3Bbin14]|nr:3-oxoacyl-[acyl-carrier-protein] synthase 2 [bacterium BMS3Abin13]GBE53694.1 3-oxoacyl-[acyl-carrier-protein] synthase 2 [bacterium BMS3Bbin14]
MSSLPVYIAGIGIISALGSGLAATEQALHENRTAVGPLQIFPLLQGCPLPVGQIHGLPAAAPLPRTHQLAGIAAEQALAGCRQPPDAIILGTTTGGILKTEQLLRDNEQTKTLYRYHGLTTVAEEIARQWSCGGPALTVSTACSSGAVAITMALQMLRAGKAEQILAGGVDSLCRLTYFGFHSLQLVDRAGCRPLDTNRQGMAVAEGAALLLLTTRRPREPLAELIGAGLSCDAYHPAAPHPEGQGALMAMQAALADAGLDPADIDYINLHGTGTPDNDLAESKAVRRLFSVPPPLSSIKGATGHSLAAAGAIEAAVAAIAVSRHLVPANTGCREPDPALGLHPVTRPLKQPLAAVLSNSFGFGGNNGCLVIGRPRPAGFSAAPVPQQHECRLAIHGSACLTGAGATAATMARLLQGRAVCGMAEPDLVAKKLPPRLVRRLKRLPRLALSLALAAHEHSGLTRKPAAIFMGTGWGALSETYDFLTRLTETEEQFPSPTDFVGSVHNAAASQVAIMFGATGANITTSGGDCSFEQALLAAALLVKDQDQSALVLGADEGHDYLSPLLDPSIAPSLPLADGGGALVVSKMTRGTQCRVRVPFYSSRRAADVLAALVAWCGGQQVRENCGLILAGIPAATRQDGEMQLAQFLTRTGSSAPVIRYRALTGEFASASAVAAVAAASVIESGRVPGTMTKDTDIPLAHKNVLVLGLGKYVTAMEFARP